MLYSIPSPARTIELTASYCLDSPNKTEFISLYSGEFFVYWLNNSNNTGPVKTPLFRSFKLVLPNYSVLDV